MKELKLIGADGIVIMASLVNVKGDDFIFTFHVPLNPIITAITLMELKKEDKNGLPGMDQRGV